jgi:hydroxyacylglutathione hydrolase
VDPTRDVDDFIRYATENDLHIKHVLETHVHADFVSGARELKARLNDEPQIHSSGLGGSEWTPPYADRVVGDGDDVQIGALRVQAVHTPGHTPEHVSWALYDETRSKDTPWLLFTGDFLFVGDVGRPDLLGEEAKKELAHQLYGSIFERLRRCRTSPRSSRRTAQARCAGRPSVPGGPRPWVSSGASTPPCNISPRSSGSAT